MNDSPRYESAAMALFDVIKIDAAPATFLETFGNVPEPLGLLFAAHCTYHEIGNGGFSQFFWNCTGVLAPEAVRAFRAIGQPNTSGVLERAMARLGSVYQRDNAERHRCMELDPSHVFPIDGRFEELSDEFIRYADSEHGGFDAAADAYLERFEAGGGPSSSG